MAVRRQFSAAHNTLCGVLRDLERLDDQNLQRVAVGNGRGAHGYLSRKQLYSLNESAFFAGFRAMENFFEECFILYTMGKVNTGGNFAVSFLSSRSYERNRTIIKANSQYLDWNTPEKVIERAEVFLRDGSPIKFIFQNNIDVLRRMKRIRNHIAHNSDESIRDFKKVLRDELGSLPIRFPSAGEFLSMRTARIIQASYLRFYLSEIRRISVQLIS